VIAAAALVALVLFLGAPTPAAGQACTLVGYGSPPVAASISAPAEVDCFVVAVGPGVLFCTDFPFDPEHGPGFIRDTIAAMERMRASAEDKAKIYAGNARLLLRLNLRG
jgi:hypothetical protein